MPYILHLCYRRYRAARAVVHRGGCMSTCMSICTYLASVFARRAIFSTYLASIFARRGIS